MYTIALKDEQTTFKPDEPIAGNVSWAELPGETQRLEVRLIWFTTGKGDRDFGIADSVTVQQPLPSGHSSFSFSAPRRPYSFSGKIVSLTWAIEVLDFPGNNAENLELVIGPSATEIVL